MSSKKVNPIRARFNAWFFDIMEGYMHKMYGRLKRKLFHELPDYIVELGSGAGANLQYYKKDTRLIAIEPNPMMHKRLHKNASRHGINLEIRGIKGEALDLGNSSVEAIVSTLVLCTVENQKQVLSEVYRVLKPGGRFLFVEHVAASRGSFLYSIQRLLHKPWHWIFEGCNLNRETALMIKDIGFSSVELHRFRLKSPFFPIAPHIAGVAIK